MRPKKFTPFVNERIRHLVKEGKTPSEIAEQIGCTVSSLRVRCSQLKISLRRKRHANELTVNLSSGASESLSRQAILQGMRKTHFIASLLEAVAKDDLFEAVLDGRAQ